jgi:cell division protein FtsX
MGDFWLVMLFIFLITGACLLVIILLQTLAKKLYNHLMIKHGESSIFLRKFYEADSWQLFGVCVMIAIFIYWAKDQVWIG